MPGRAGGESTTVGVVMPKRTRAVIEARAEAAGLSLSAFCRHVLLVNAGVLEAAPAAPPDAAGG